MSILALFIVGVLPADSTLKPTWINEALITLVFTELSRTGMRTSSHCVLPASHRAVNEQ